MMESTERQNKTDDEMPEVCKNCICNDVCDNKPVHCDDSYDDDPLYWAKRDYIW